MLARQVGASLKQSRRRIKPQRTKSGRHRNAKTMPLVEIASFITSEYAEDDQEVLDKAIDSLKKTKGCLSVHRGFQVDDSQKSFMIVVWETVDNVNATKRQLGVLLDPLSIQQFFVVDDPTNVFESPLPALRFAQPTAGHTAAELEALCVAFDARVRRQEFVDLPFEWWPLWTIGTSRDNAETTVYLIGWQNAEIREKVLLSKPWQKLMEGVYAHSYVDIRPLALTKA